jgi:hypothetical protein
MMYIGGYFVSSRILNMDTRYPFFSPVIPDQYTLEHLIYRNNVLI